jgi:hypothetical protein
MKKSFKVGDRVQMKDSYRDWLIKTIPEMYTIFSGEYVHKFHDSELLALFTAREFNEPLRGTIEKFSQAVPEALTCFVIFENKYGTYSGWVPLENLIKLRKVKKCKKCGAKQ